MNKIKAKVQDRIRRTGEPQDTAMFHTLVEMRFCQVCSSRHRGGGGWCQNEHSGHKDCFVQRRDTCARFAAMETPKEVSHADVFGIS